MDDIVTVLTTVDGHSEHGVDNTTGGYSNWTNLSEYSSYDNFEYAYPDVDVSVLALPTSAQIGLIVLYALTIVFSVGGNLLVIVVLFSAKRMRTDINIFLMNLAVADLFMACFCLPFSFTRTMLGRWIFGQIMCPLVLFMQVLSVTVSIYTNMAIGLDRFWGVVFPMRPRLTRAKALQLSAVIWLFGASLASAQLVVSRSNLRNFYGIRYWDCNEHWPTETGRRAYTLLVVGLTYFLPLSILAAVYSKIGSILWLRRLPGNADGPRDKLLLRSKQKVVRMVFTLVVVFAVCWFPLHAFHLVLDFAPYLLDYITSAREQNIFVAVFYICHWLAMANSFTNPIIFCFLNENFRADLKALMTCRHLRQSLRVRRPRTFVYRLSQRLTRSRTSSVRSTVASWRNNKPARPPYYTSQPPGQAAVSMSSHGVEPMLRETASPVRENPLGEQLAATIFNKLIHVERDAKSGDYLDLDPPTCSHDDRPQQDTRRCDGGDWRL